jgi:phosphonate degradation associated HDIG domain protein
MTLRVSDILELYETSGLAWYGGEAISQLDHALQCATLAAESGASAELVVACLLHDIGHLLALRTAAGGAAGDDVHQYVALPFLRDYPEAVLAPIRLHVDAKRYLCFAEPGYWDSLSPASKDSLDLQGGPFGPNAAARFNGLSHAAEALRLRRWDDQAKVSGARVPGLREFADLLEQVRLSEPAASSPAG